MDCHRFSFQSQVSVNDAVVQQPAKANIDDAVTEQQEKKKECLSDSSFIGSQLHHRTVEGYEGQSCIGLYCCDSEATRDEFDLDYFCFCIRCGKPTPDSYYKDWYESHKPIFKYTNQEDEEQDIQRYESVPTTENLKIAGKMRENQEHFKQKTPQDLIPTQPKELSILRLIANAATDGKFPLDPPEESPSTSLLDDDPTKVMRDRDSEEKKKPKSSLTGIIADLAPEVSSNLDDGICGHGGGVTVRTGGHKQFNGGDVSAITSHVMDHGPSRGSRQAKTKQQTEQLNSGPDFNQNLKSRTKRASEGRSHIKSGLSVFSG